MLNPFKWLFEFPPVEKRPELKGRIRYPIFWDYDRTLDETYIYYKIFILNLWLNAIFMAPYFLSFFLQADIDLGLFEIHYRPDASVDELVFSYPKHIFPVLASVTIIYSIALFAWKTNYFSKERITREHVATMYWNKQLFQIKPLRLAITIAFLLATGYTLWTGPEALRFYILFNVINDFREHTVATFLLFAALYVGFYVAFYAQGLTCTVSNFIRSVLRHYVYRNQLINPPDINTAQEV